MAMASLQRIEFEEAITCPVCMARYDENVKKPKYLVSCCHTLCISCLERICANSGMLRRVVCPICRCLTTCSAGIESLPTNHDKLYLLKLEQPLKNNECMNWCFTCKKKASPDCSIGNHSVVAMDSQVLNSNIQLNLGTISSRLQTSNQSILQNRIKIKAKLDQFSRWLAFYQEMIGWFKSTNSTRISELNEIIQGSDITISLQQLMQLSLDKQHDLTLLSDTLEEESAMKEMMQEFETVEKMGEISAKDRFNGLLDLPSLPRIRKELDCNNFCATQKTPLQWPIVLIESIASSFCNPSSSQNNDGRLFVGLPQLESRYFASRSGEETTVYNATTPTNMTNSTVNTRNSSSGFTRPTGSGFVVENSSQTGAREKLSARRRRPPSIN